MEFTPMHEVLKPGAFGDARIEHFVVSKEDSERTRWKCFGPGGRENFVDAGTYCRLYVKNCLVMSDTPMERRSNSGVVHRANGDVLIAGLGLGMILAPILKKKEVRSVLVVEKNSDVVQLVGPQIEKLPGGEKLSVVGADIFHYSPKGVKFDTIYFDIWSTISEDNLGQMARLHQKFKSRKRPGAWMESWKRDELKWRREQYKRAGWG